MGKLKDKITEAKIDLASLHEAKTRSHLLAGFTGAATLIGGAALAAGAAMYSTAETDEEKDDARKVLFGAGAAVGIGFAGYVTNEITARKKAENMLFDAYCAGVADGFDDGVYVSHINALSADAPAEGIEVEATEVSTEDIPEDKAEDTVEKKAEEPEEKPVKQETKEPESNVVGNIRPETESSSESSISPEI